MRRFFSLISKRFYAEYTTLSFSLVYKFPLLKTIYNNMVINWNSFCFIFICSFQIRFFYVNIVSAKEEVDAKIATDLIYSWLLFVSLRRFCLSLAVLSKSLARIALWLDTIDEDSSALIVLNVFDFEPNDSFGWTVGSALNVACAYSLGFWPELSQRSTFELALNGNAKWSSVAALAGAAW